MDPNTFQDILCIINSNISESDLRCPILHEIIVDPVIGDDNKLYDRQSLEKWFQKCDANNEKHLLPITRIEQTSPLVTNATLKALCDHYRALKNEDDEENSINDNKDEDKTMNNSIDMDAGNGLHVQSDGVFIDMPDQVMDDLFNRLRRSHYNQSECECCRDCDSSVLLVIFLLLIVLGIIVFILSTL